MDGAGDAALGPEAALAGGGHRDQEGRRPTGELWQILDALGDERPEYVLEQFVPGDVYHVDSLVFDRRIVFAAASRYGTPPMAVAHEGGIFVTRTLSDEDATAQRLKAMNARVLESFGLLRGVSHTEFIRSHDGEVYFLETSARVGGAYIVDVVEAATGINLWREWAKIEIAGEHGTYVPPPSKGAYAGIVLSLARQEEPDLSAYDDPEIVTRVEEAPSRRADRRRRPTSSASGSSSNRTPRASTTTSTRPRRPPSARRTDQDISARQELDRDHLRRVPDGLPRQEHRVAGHPAAARHRASEVRCVGDVVDRRPAAAPGTFATRSCQLCTMNTTGRPGGHSTRCSKPSTRSSPGLISR